VFGREVNLASRLEALSGRGRILIGEATYAALKRDDPALAATCSALPLVNVKGFREAVKVYEVPWRLPGEMAPVEDDYGSPDTSTTGFIRLEG
jgi:class 3 adenylate cyclase